MVKEVGEKQKRAADCACTFQAASALPGGAQRGCARGAVAPPPAAL